MDVCFAAFVARRCSLWALLDCLFHVFLPSFFVAVCFILLRVCFCFSLLCFVVSCELLSYVGGVGCVCYFMCCLLLLIVFCRLSFVGVVV